MPEVAYVPNRKVTCRPCRDRAAAEFTQKRARERAEAVRYFLAWLPRAPHWPEERTFGDLKRTETRPADIVLPIDQAAEKFANAAVPGNLRLFSFDVNNGRPKSYENCVLDIVWVDTDERYHWYGSVYQLPGNRILVYWNWDSVRHYMD